MPLRILIVGAGIAGLATAIALARHGHDVQVFERRPPSDRELSGSGIQFQPNIVKILEKWGMMAELTKVAHDNEMAALRLHDGGIIVRQDYKHKGPAFFGLRSVYKDLFRDFALRAGAKIFEGTKVVEIHAEVPTILLEDGKCVEADLIIGADGAHSKVRRLIYPTDHLHDTKTVTFQIVLPLSLVKADQTLRTVVDGVHNMVTVAPGRMVFSSILPKQGLVDIQFGDLDSQHDSTSNERIYDLQHLKDRFKDYPDEFLEAIDLADSAFKWRIVEVIGLPSWSNGCTVLLGDAAHAMMPFAGQGSAMGIEDAAVLSELLADASSGDDLRPLIQMYESLRRPRCEKVAKLARLTGQAWASSDAKQIERRNSAWQEQSLNDPTYVGAEPDENASYASPSFQKWLDHYDVFAVVAEAKKRYARQSKI